MRETDVGDGGSALTADEGARPDDESLPELWDGSFHLAYERWLAETRERVAQEPVVVGIGAEGARRDDVQPGKQTLE
jgi:hypothetical protein